MKKAQPLRAMQNYISSKMAKMEIYAVKKIWKSSIKVSVKENGVPTEKNSSRASIFATKASYISN